MKRIAILLLLSAGLVFGEEITLTNPAVLRADRSMVSLKAGTVVELISRGEKVLTVRHGKLTGTIPVNSVGSPAPATGSGKKPEAAPARPAPPASGGKATTNYGKAVEKAKDSVAKRGKNVVQSADEIIP